MDWNSANLNSRDRDAMLIDGLSFDELLLEINCNIPNEDINEKTVTEQFETDLKNRMREARKIFKSNLKNIVKQAMQEKKDI